MKEIKVGNIIGEPGKIIYGWYDILEHPTGTIEKLPIIIAQGLTEGPTLWLTANIHGDEYTGIPVIHGLLEQIYTQELKGTIVAIPTLNPSGSRIATRYPYYDKKDPNRLFPDGNPFKEDTKNFDRLEITDQKDITNETLEKLKLKSETHIEIAIQMESETKDPLAAFAAEEKFPSIQEIIFTKLFEQMKFSANVLIDLHNAYIKSIPFIFLDRVLYNHEENEEEMIHDATLLFEKTLALAKAFGFTIIREETPKRYIQKKLHRSTSGAALNFLRIPSFTVELGMRLVVDEKVVEAAIFGIKNVMKHLEMIAGAPEKLSNTIVLNTNQSMRYVGHPRMTQSGIVELKVKEGDFVKKGQTIALAKDIFGKPLKEGSEIKTELDGYIFMINEGIFRYPNEEICWIASNDLFPMIAKWPK